MPSSANPSSSSESSQSVRIRPATLEDLSTIASFNKGLAWETETLQLDEPTLAAGVETALKDPDRLRYWLLEMTQADGSTQVVGQAAVNQEWSDWRGGWIWWMQSVYINREYRRQGLFRQLYRQIEAEAKNASEVVGLRLYVDHENHSARQTYEALGMQSANYLVYEAIWGSSESIR